jgi:hypothetical protein
VPGGPPDHAGLNTATSKDQVSPILQIDKGVGGQPPVDMTAALTERAGIARWFAEHFPRTRTSIVSPLVETKGWLQSRW